MISGLSSYSVACIVVTFNGAAWIDRCIQSLQKSTVASDIIIVDNASVDSTLSIVAQYPSVKLINTGGNLGFGRANNIGIAHALECGADYVFIFNQDAEVFPDSLERLLSVARENVGLGILGPMQLDADGVAIDPIFLQHYVAIYAQAMLGDSILGRPLRGYYRVSAIPAAAWLLTRPFLLKVGGFDPLFFMYCEDDDVCARAILHGWDIAVVPAALYTHARGFYAHVGSESDFKRFERRRSRIRSILIKLIKKPAGSMLKNAWHAAVKHALAGCDAVVGHLDWVEALANWAAILQVLVELPVIAAHRRKCMTTGAHWLPPASGKSPLSN